MGLEWEIARNFSVAVTGVVRRVNGLGDGAKVGGPSSSDNIPTFKEFRFGVGVVINVSPDIMQVGRSMASSMSGSN